MMSIRVTNGGRAFAITTILLALIYGWTTAPFITLMDAGDLATAALTLGVAHPPGYPLFTILGFAFSKILWFIEPAHRIACMNALFGALASGVFSLLLQRLFSNLVLSVFGALSVALSSMAWSLGSTIEVYMLNLLINNLLWFVAIDLKQNFRSKSLFIFSLLAGVGLSSSYPLILLSGLGLILVLPKESFRLRNLGVASLGLAAGLLPYLYLIFQSTRNEKLDYIFFDLKGIGMVPAYIMRSQYFILDQIQSSFNEKIAVLGWFARALVKDFAITSLLVVLGLAAAFKYRFALRWPLLIATLSSSILLYLLLGTKPEMDSFVQFYEYVLPTLTYLAVFAVFGMNWLWQRLRLPVWAASLLCSLAVASQAILAYPVANNHGNGIPDLWANTLLNSLPQKANLILCSDEFALPYLHIVKAVRPDIRIYSNYISGSKRYLYERGPDVSDSIRQRLALDTLLASPGALVYVTDCGPRYQQEGYKTSLKGLSYQILGSGAAEQPGMPMTQESMKALVASLREGPAQADHWMMKLRARTTRLLLTYAYQMKLIGVADLDAMLTQYGLKDDPAFVASLGAEFAYTAQYDVSIGIYRLVPKASMRKARVDDIAVYCRLLILADEIERARDACQVVEDESVGCNGDSKYNLARVYWKDRAKSIELLRAANACAPQADAIKEALEKRLNEP